MLDDIRKYMLRMMLIERPLFYADVEKLNDAFIFSTASGEGGRTAKFYAAVTLASAFNLR